MFSGIRGMVLAVALGALAVSGCSAPTSSPRPGGRETTLVRDTETPQRTWCDKSIGTPETLPRGYEEILGAVALPTSRTARRALQAGDGAGSDVLFAKTGLLVRGDQSVVIEQVPGSGAAGDPPALLGWGEVAPATRFTARPCPGAPEWRVFAGGLYVARPACVHLRVRVGGRTTEVSVGAGAPCPGQRRPVSVG